MNRFNIRVYGIYIERDRLLVTDEIRFGQRMTKLPGGGLELGESIEEGLKREFLEELSAEIEVGEVVYVNPFFQRSAFRETDQMICLYFWVNLLSPLVGTFSEIEQDFSEEEGDQQIFRWVPLEDLSEETFTYPIDRALVPKLKKLHG
ncbi:MAG: NUDIX domain-containing protein [Bacteroidia bacterium]|nr:NUDIX domain-containing protein [Bacteroidia bacterium]